MYIHPLLANFEKFIKEMDTLHSVLDRVLQRLPKKYENDGGVDYVNENMDLEEYQNKWKKANIRFMKVKHWNDYNKFKIL